MLCIAAHLQKKYLEADWDVAPVAKSFAVEIKNIIWKPLQYCLLAIPSPGIMANGQEPRPHRQNTFQTFWLTGSLSCKSPVFI